MKVRHLRQNMQSVLFDNRIEAIHWSDNHCNSYPPYQLTIENNDVRCETRNSFIIKRLELQTLLHFCFVDRMMFAVSLK